MELLMTRRKKYGYIFKGWLINTAFISISHPDDIMVKQIHALIFYKLMICLLYKIFSM